VTLVALLRHVLILALLSFFSFTVTAQSQQADPHQLRLAKVEFKGLEHITREQALDLSGLDYWRPDNCRGP